REPIVAERAHSYLNDPSKTELVLSEEQPIATPSKKSSYIATNLRSFKAERSVGFDNDPSRTELVLSEQAPDMVIDTKNDKAIGRSRDAERIEAFTGDKSKTELVVSDVPPSPSHQYPKPPPFKPINVDRPALEFVLSELAPSLTRNSQSSAAPPIGNAECALDFESDESKTELVVSELAPSTLKNRGRPESTAIFDAERAAAFEDDKSKTEFVVSELAPKLSNNFKADKNEYLGEQLTVIKSRPAGNEKAERSESHVDDIFISKTELRISENSEISPDHP
uniref:Uncharacterized protein n=1 Tax=Romanomermis culicivorax TaxID=13658 RepID=A0A915HXZ3_ROMCU